MASEVMSSSMLAARPAAHVPGGRRSAQRRSLAVRYTVASVILVVTVLPYLYIILQAFAVPTQVGDLVPTAYSWHTFIALFTSAGSPWVSAIGNSVIVTVVDTTSRVVIGALAGYAISIVGFRGARFVSNVVLLQMFYPAVILVVPLFMMVQRAHMYNTLGGMIIPFLADAWAVFMYTAFFRSVPTEMIEAARLDGAGHFRIVFRVLVPMLGPVTTVVALCMVVWRWTDAFWDLIIVSKPANMTLNVLLAGQAGAVTSTDAVREPGLVFAAAAVLTLPLVAVFLVFSKRFAAGLDMSLR
jgi:multiple sugar transport system permease protein